LAWARSRPPTTPGATTIALTRTSAKKRQLREAGAVHVIATEEVDLVGEVVQITNGQGARGAFDPVGGPSFPNSSRHWPPVASSTSTACSARLSPHCRCWR
jgi:NADPH:quinone reductase-like Zn-dependent oxidoreductase